MALLWLWPVQPLPALRPPSGRLAKKPKVEVVFCLDTTGSMGGLIDGAKAKIWAICNQIANGKPIPDLKVGLVAFRDKGDAYITKVIDLSDDLDAIHGHLKKFQAAGGGDLPESVNQALDDSVNKVKWSTDKKTLRIIFLVGDAPPHMDYTDDVKYPVTCKKAVEKGIIINTIQCGVDPNCTKYWKDIAVKSEGSFAAIPQRGGVVAIATPFDARLAKINKELTGTTLVYGTAGLKAARVMEKMFEQPPEPLPGGGQQPSRLRRQEQPGCRLRSDRGDEGQKGRCGETQGRGSARGTEEAQDPQGAQGIPGEKGEQARRTEQGSDRPGQETRRPHRRRDEEGQGQGQGQLRQ